eukprot:TRINITY_DN9220_c0_g1_i1.p1 TRINITY_DN9220_c0_g1~~TRINITY_DN9220_c0_g1_i1.p1  ORF type:complete len:192 (+),score=19.87 TRINITY_DN9220_c0_g1_i1:105-680(+)
MAPTRRVVLPSSLPMLVLACVLASVVAMAASPPPTIPQFKAELIKFGGVLKKSKDYKAFSQAVDRMLKRPDKDLKVTFNRTFLVPINKALYKLGIGTLTNMTAMEKIGPYNILAKMYRSKGLLAMKPGTKLPTLLTGQSLQVYKSAVAGKMAYGPPQTATINMGTILKADLFNGTFIKAHGVSVYFRPPGY